MQQSNVMWYWLLQAYKGRGLRIEDEKKVSMQTIFHWGFHIIPNLNRCPQLSPILSSHQETFDNAYATSLHQALCPQYSMKKGNEKNGELANFAIFSSFNINLLTCNINTSLNHCPQLFFSVNTTRSHPTIPSSLWDHSVLACPYLLTYMTSMCLWWDHWVLSHLLCAHWGLISSPMACW